MIYSSTMFLVTTNALILHATNLEYHPFALVFNIPYRFSLNHLSLYFCCPWFDQASWIIFSAPLFLIIQFESSDSVMFNIEFITHMHMFKKILINNDNGELSVLLEFSAYVKSLLFLVEFSRRGWLEWPCFYLFVHV